VSVIDLPSMAIAVVAEDCADNTPASVAVPLTVIE
jgi:hypothetical protein